MGFLSIGVSGIRMNQYTVTPCRTHPALSWRLPCTDIDKQNVGSSKPRSSFISKAQLIAIQHKTSHRHPPEVTTRSGFTFRQSAYGIGPNNRTQKAQHATWCITKSRSNSFWSVPGAARIRRHGFVFGIHWRADAGHSERRSADTSQGDCQRRGGRHWADSQQWYVVCPAIRPLTPCLRSC